MCYNQSIHEFDYDKLAKYPFCDHCCENYKRYHDENKPPLDVTSASMDNGLVVVNCKFQLVSNFQFFFPFADLNFECSKSRDVSTSTYYVVNHDVYYL